MTIGCSRPRRRQTTHVETLHGERCIYEWTTRTVHALNPAAARVWNLCDGETTIEAMVAVIGRNPATGDAGPIVRHALEQFDRAGLLEPGSFAAAPAPLSRRAVLRRIGVAAAVPIVTSIAAPTPLAAQSGNTHTFNYIGSPQSFVVPAGVSLLTVDAIGGIGGISPPSFGGGGGRVQATIPVTAGETLGIMVGGFGSNGFSNAFNGGGAGGSGAAGGGGASDVRRGSTLLVVAGGGGGGGTFGGSGGSGGGLVGAAGTGTCGNGGGGGTQSAGGAAGSSDPGGFPGSAGTAGTGGAGSLGNPPTVLGAGGGGGGYFGGGGGGSCSTNAGGGGGGGSSYTDPFATNVVHTQGYPLPSKVTVSW